MNIINLLLSFKFMFLLWIILIIILYIKYDKEYSLFYKDKYNSKMPGEYTPAEMKVLVNYGKLYPRDIAATFIDLILKKVILVQKKINENSKLESKQKDYIIKRNDSNTNIELMNHELMLLNWLFNIIGNGENITLNQIKDFTRKNVSAIEFKQEYLSWCKTVNKTSKRNDFFKSGKVALFFGIAISILYTFVSVFLTIYFNHYRYLFLLILSLITFIYSLNIIKRTPYGQKQYELWMSFKRYLRDLDDINSKCDIKECEKYIPYAISLGVEQQLLDFITKNHNSEELKNKDLTIFNTISHNELINLIKQTNKIFETSIKASYKAKI